MAKNPFNIIIDFDSTFVQVEALDCLARIALRNHPEKHIRLGEIERITKLGMEGLISFDQSLKKRFALLDADRQDVEELITVLKKNITPSFFRNKKFIRKHRRQIYILSGGFFNFIHPVLEDWGIEEDHVLANNFIFNKKGRLIGYDEKNILAQNGGKMKIVQGLRLKGKIYVIGDGYTDYQIKAAGLAHKFFAFTENVCRESVVKKADAVVKNFEEVINFLSLD